MNVLVCIPCLMTGGTEIQTLNLVKALITAEHKVILNILQTWWNVISKLEATYAY